MLCLGWLMSLCSCWHRTLHLTRKLLFWLSWHCVVLILLPLWPLLISFPLFFGLFPCCPKMISEFLCWVSVLSFLSYLIYLHGWCSGIHLCLAWLLLRFHVPISKCLTSICLDISWQLKFNISPVQATLHFLLQSISSSPIPVYLDGAALLSPPHPFTCQHYLCAAFSFYVSLIHSVTISLRSDPVNAPHICSFSLFLLLAVPTVSNDST